MTKAKNIGLFILLIIQAALIVYLYRPGQGAPPRAMSLFSGLRRRKEKPMALDPQQA